MTAFDALMPSGAGASAAGAGGVRPGGGSGDWRQAVEKAQARSWLGDRTLAAAQGREQSGPGVSVSPAVSLADRAAQTAGPFAGPRGQGREAVDVPGTDLPPAVARRQAVKASPAEAWLPTPRGVALPLATASASPRGATALSAAAGQGEVLRSARARKQSIHAESGEQGVSVWIRDASLNSREARHLAAAIASNLSSGRQDVALLYLNGRPVVDGRQLSSPQSSE